MKSIQPYASWSSELTPEMLATKGSRYGHMDHDAGRLYWLESRPEESGRGVLVCYDPEKNSCRDVLPETISVRSRVHEYGGGDFIVADSKVYFSNADDNRVYSFDGALTSLTPLQTEKEHRYADFCLDPKQDYLIAIRETHTQGKVVNELVSIDLQKKTVKVIHSGFDFYSTPKISQQGQRICWLCWNQPDMPWDAAELWLADYHNGGYIDAAHRVTGGDSHSIFQPEWSEQGVLHYISDKNGWSNIYNHSKGVLNALAPIDRDFALPQWLFGMCTYVINSDENLYACHFEDGLQQLCHINVKKGHIEPISLPFKNFKNQLLGDNKYLYFCAAGPATDSAIYRYDIATKNYQCLTGAKSFPLLAGDISLGKPISFKSKNQRICHAFYYGPVNSRYQGVEGTYPPLIVMSHGGPTAATHNSLDANIQFWTNRGFAVVDVNYSGSTGYGKKYRERLTSEWGVLDVEDCIAAANYLVEKKLANKDQLLIRGGSAGGYTTLCALTFHNIFAAGMSRYGVADLEALAAESHKFEARYLDKMIGPYPEKKSTYQARSPIHHAEQLSCPILLLQGEDDKVVPPSQAELMVQALEENKIPYGYLLFEGEGHGFRQKETIINAFSAELYFYRKVLNIESKENIEPIKIKFL